MDSAPREVDLDITTSPWALENFAAAILTHGPIRVKRSALEAVRAHSMGLCVYQEWDERTQTMTYTIPEGASNG